MKCNCCGATLSLTDWDSAWLVAWYKSLKSATLLRTVKELLKNSRRGTCSNCGYECYVLDSSVHGEYYKELTHVFPKYFADHREEWRAVSDIINTAAVSKPQTVVDIGCGSGAFLSRLLGAVETIGVDFESHVDFGSDVQFFQQNLNNIDYLPSASYYTSFQVMEHLQNPDQFLESIRVNSERPSLLYLSVPNSENYRNKRFLDPLNFPPHHLNRFTHQSLNHLFSRHFSSFEVTPIEPINLPRVLVRTYNQLERPPKTLDLVRAAFDWFGDRQTRYESFLVRASVN